MRMVEIKKQLIDLSLGVRNLAHKCIDEISGILQKEHEAGTQITLRTRMLYALALKMLRSYEAMLIDAEHNRPECMHHLKTIVESFIYFYWVIRDGQGFRSNFILAECANQKINFFNPKEFYPPDYLSIWQDEFRLRKKEFELGGKIFGRKTVKKIAEEAQLEERFYDLYRLCCEVPHLGDVMEYLPTMSKRIVFHKPEISGLWSIVALEHGNHLMISLIKTGIEAYNLEHGEELRNLNRRILEFYDKK